MNNVEAKEQVASVCFHLVSVDTHSRVAMVAESHPQNSCEFLANHQ